MKGLLGNRTFSFGVIILIYIVAAVVGILTFTAFSGDMILRLFAADCTATLFVWLVGVLLKNSSVYDPYWSVAPAVMVPLTAAYLHMLNAGVGVLVAVILFWGTRLTANWAHTFHSLREQDWRYTKLKNDRPKIWFFTNLFGINLFPTLIVFLLMLPAFLFILYFHVLNLFTLLGALLSVFAACLQLVSDRQMRAFRRNPQNAGKVNDQGLWKYTRHPNYLGEILMWWGIYFMLISVNIAYWKTFIGPLANTIMFLTVSIPLMETRQLQNKPEYARYKEETGMLMPRFFRRSSTSTLENH